MGIVKFFWIASLTSVIGSGYAQSVNSITQVGDKLEMQCGQHRIVLTCGHSDEIATRQKTYPRLCNDNKVEFIAKDGSSKTFTTYTKGQHRDKTAVSAVCKVLQPINVYELVLWTHDTVSNFAIPFSEAGVRLNDDTGTDHQPKGYPSYTYGTDYKESKTVGRIQVKERK